MYYKGKESQWKDVSNAACDRVKLKFVKWNIFSVELSGNDLFLGNVNISNSSINTEW